MDRIADRKALVAVDLGAQSCRVSVLRWDRGEPQIQLVHRFPNSPRETSTGLRWDVEGIYSGIDRGLRIAANKAPEGIASIAIDGWAVDYVRLLENGSPVADSFCYRDPRTEQAEREVHAILPASRLYALTGVQILRINTLYQLYADKLANDDPKLPWINLPEFMTYRLCGKRVSEYTNATHSSLVALGTHKWSEIIFNDLGLDLGAAPEIVPSGSILGQLTGDLAQLPEFCNAKMIVPACHDTASAIAAIPATGEDWAFISSGTWSLLGTVLESPCVSDAARAANFTNLGGIGGKICFLKNVNGMWLLRQCMDEWEKLGERWSLPKLLSACASLPPPKSLIDVDDPQLMLPGDTLNKINEQLRRLVHAPLTPNHSGVPAIANLVVHSLAARYAEVLSAIAKITGKKLKRLFIVGGGNQNTLLNRLTAERAGIEVILGSTESTTIGNFAVQLAALQGDSSSSTGATRATGVSADSVARWAERLVSQSLAPVSDPATD
jgi:rhamnulokinase